MALVAADCLSRRPSSAPSLDTVATYLPSGETEARTDLPLLVSLLTRILWDGSGEAFPSLNRPRSPTNKTIAAAMANTETHTTIAGRLLSGFGNLDSPPILGTTAARPGTTDIPLAKVECPLPAATPEPGGGEPGPHSRDVSVSSKSSLT